MKQVRKVWKGDPQWHHLKAWVEKQGYGNIAFIAYTSLYGAVKSTEFYETEAIFKRFRTEIEDSIKIALTSIAKPTLA